MLFSSMIIPIREFGVRKSFVKEVKIVLFIFSAVGRLFNMAGFTLYYVPLNIEHGIDAGKY